MAGPMNTQGRTRQKRKKITSMFRHYTHQINEVMKAKPQDLQAQLDQVYSTAKVAHRMHWMTDDEFRTIFRMAHYTDRMKFYSIMAASPLLKGRN